jgi:Flp pilus assembly protein TadB
MDKLINRVFILTLGVLMILLGVQLCVHGHYGVAIGCALVATVFGAIFYIESRK